MITECNRIWQYQDTDIGLILPWFTLPCLEWLKKQDISQWNIFEYGCGYSTIWFRSHCNSIVSVDHSKNWAQAMSAICHEDKDDFIKSIIPKENGAMFELGNEFITINPEFQWDCVIVDSEYWREECVDFCLPYIKPGGYLIIDNWGQENFPNTEKYLEVLKYWEVQIFKQPNHSMWATAVFKKTIA